MRTTIDIPDSLVKRVKLAAAQRKTTMRRLMLDALERSLRDSPPAFTLRDAAAGSDAHTVDAKTINRAIDAERDQPFMR